MAFPPAADAVLLAIALTGVSFSGPLMAATAAPALAIAFWRNALGAGYSVGLSGLRHRSELRGLSLRSIRTAGFAGLALAAHFGTWVPSVTMTSVASATALVSTQTVFAAVIAHLRGRRLPNAAWIGIVICVVATGLIAGADFGHSTRALIGDLLAVVGGFCAAVYVTAGASARKHLTTATYTSLCYSSCAIILLWVCLVGRVDLSGYSGNAWLKIVLVTVCAQLLGHTLINVVLRSTSPTVVSLAILFETPGAALIALIWLNQHPPLTAIPGLVLLFAGLVVVARSRGREAPVEVTE